MKVLLAQPRQATDTYELALLLGQHAVELAVFPEDYIKGPAGLREACLLAKDFGVVIATGLLNEPGVPPKRQAIIINRDGTVALDRPKTPKNEPLHTPLVAHTAVGRIGMLLCREIFMDVSRFPEADIIVNPISVGMYSEGQFSEWSGRAQSMAKQLTTAIIGVSHSTGSFLPKGISIPIAFAFDKLGNPSLLLRDYIRPVTLLLPDLREVTASPSALTEP